MHKPIFVYHRSPHHAGYSGYGQLINYIDGDVTSLPDSKIPYRLAGAIVNLINQDKGKYNKESLEKEYQTFEILKDSHSKRIVHYLNGERDVRFIPKYFSKKAVCVATFHKPVEVLEDWIKDWSSLRRLKGAIAISANQVAYLKTMLPDTHVQFIPHGVDLNFFKPNDRAEVKPNVLFVGQHLRDFDCLNQVILAAEKNNVPISFDLVLQKFGQKTVVKTSNAKFHSRISDEELKILYQQSSLTFIPFKSVTACNSLLEAMACGKPIISTTALTGSGYAENDDVFVFGNADITGILDRIEYLINNPITISNSALSEAEHFSWIKVAERVKVFYDTLL